MEPNTSPLQDGEPTPYVDTEAAWEFVKAELDRMWGLPPATTPEGKRHLRIVRSLADTMAGREGLSAPELEAGP